MPVVENGLKRSKGRKKRGNSGGFVVIQRNNSSLNKEMQGKHRKADTSRQILETEQIQIATELYKL